MFTVIQKGVLSRGIAAYVGVDDIFLLGGGKAPSPPLRVVACYASLRVYYDSLKEGCITQEFVLTGYRGAKRLQPISPPV